jgi:hypothetical protein
MIQIRCHSLPSFAAFVGVLAFAGAAFAADPPAPAAPDEGEADGMVNASSLRPLPKGSALTVRPWDNSSDMIELAHHIEEQLRLRGYTVGGADALVLKFSMFETLGQLSGGRQRQLVEIDGQAGSSSDTDTQVRLNLFSTDKGGVFNEGRPQQKVASTQTLEMTLDRPDGQRLWIGEATGKLANQDRRQNAHALVAPLLDNMGKTARSQPFGMPDPNDR